MLQNNDYKEYIDSIFKLVASMVIKLDMINYTMNDYLTKIGVPINSNLSEQRYYKLLNGQYFNVNQSGGDKSITIRSLDTQEIISFNKNVLINHPKTLATYKRLGTEFDELVKLHPYQEFLIRRILFPIDIDTAINAKNGTILYYDKSLVEPNELTLMKSIQLWIYNYISRWGGVPYQITDALYASSFLALLNNHLITVIINQRLKRVKTYETHSFYKWQYLAGYFELDLFKNRLSLHQSLVLYKNIDYIIQNSGKQKLLNFLYENLLSPSGLTLKDVYLRKSNNNVLYSGFSLNLNNNNLNPEISVSTSDITNSALQDDLLEQITVKDVLADLKNKALLNPVNLNMDIESTNTCFLSNNSTEIPTGVIECSTNFSELYNAIDYDTLILNYWFYLVGNDLFNYNAKIEIPYDKPVLKILTIKEWTVILFYCMLKVKHELIDDKIPKVYVDYILKTPEINKDILGGLLLNEYRYVYKVIDSIPIVIDNIDEILNDIQDPYEVNSLLEFKNQIDYVFSRLFRHILNIESFQYSDAQSQLEDIVSRLYRSYEISLSEYSTFTEFFNSIDYDFSDLTDQQAYNLLTNILTNILGSNSLNQNLKDPQKALVEILEIVCSYTIKFIKGKINLGNKQLPMIYSGIYPNVFKSLTTTNINSQLSHNSSNISEVTNIINYITGIETYITILDNLVN